MGKWLPQTCWADSKINKIVIIASSLSFILFNYIKLIFHNSDFKKEETERMYYEDKSVNAVAGINNRLVLETLDMHKYIP